MGEPLTPPVYPGEIVRSLVGSTMHGTGLEGHEDTDYMGVCLERAETVTGLGHFEQYQFRTQPEGARSGFGDIDCVVYSARKYLHLATKGNPSVLLLLFVPGELLPYTTPAGESLRALAPAIVSKNVAAPFKGYLKAQRDRLLGLRGGKHTNRPELIETFGYDTKYAMHMVRLGFQGREIMRTGRITLPMPLEEREICLAIRHGQVSKDYAVDLADRLYEEIEGLESTSSLPDEPDFEKVDYWLHDRHMEYWSSRAFGVTL